MPSEHDHTASLIEHWKAIRGQLNVTLSGVVATGDVGVVVPAVGTAEGTASVGGISMSLEPGEYQLESQAAPMHLETAAPGISVGAVLIDLGPKIDEGRMVLAVRPAWRRIFDEVVRDRNAVYKLEPHQFEEFNAAAYDGDGWIVTLTPRSGDGGRDIIAIQPDGFRVLVQVKLRTHGRRVKADEVRSLVGVLSRDPAASKAVFTTTSVFAPGVEGEFADMTPTRLELRDGPRFQEWLKKIKGKS